MQKRSTTKNISQLTEACIIIFNKRKKNKIKIKNMLN